MRPRTSCLPITGSSRIGHLAPVIYSTTKARSSPRTEPTRINQTWTSTFLGTNPIPGEPALLKPTFPMGTTSARGSNPGTRILNSQDLRGILMILTAIRVICTTNKYLHQLPDGPWCSSAYVCNHQPSPVPTLYPTKRTHTLSPSRPMT